ncbi:MAG: hypothetical protein ACR2PK_17600, partial [Acidimicrobiales bacterium]
DPAAAEQHLRIAYGGLDKMGIGADAGRDPLLLLACEAALASGDLLAAQATLNELDAASGDGRVDAWAACFHGQLIIMTDQSQLSFADASVDAAAERLADLGDDAGVAKARQVRAGVLARLGRVGECEAELDLALTAARNANDMRRVSAVLASAPLAALWGPSPVPRAGGRCLDVVRLLRITSGSPAVEATSLRCQAVLESFRGRFDTARTMLSTARDTAEELGLRQSLMETELFSGIVELTAGDPAAAEQHLRIAYGGLDKMGIGADAGLAAAYLAQSLLGQEMLDEAEALASDSDALAGQNTQTAITARSAHAEILAARGSWAEALELAEEAAALGASTDIVVDHANACRVLADVRAGAGDDAGSDQARAEAARLFALKGVTAGAVASAQPVAAPELTQSETEPSINDVLDNTASRLVVQVRDLVVAGDLEAAMQLVEPDFSRPDRRPLVSMPDTAGARETLELWRSRYLEGGSSHSDKVVATRGDSLALLEVGVEWRDGVSGEWLIIASASQRGLLQFLLRFDPEDFNDAMVELERLTLARLPDQLAHTWRAVADMGIAIRNRDRAQVFALHSPDFVAVDHRQLSWPTLDAAGFVERALSVRMDTAVWAREILDLTPDLVMFTVELVTPDLDVRRIDTWLHDVRDGLVVRSETFADHAFKEARERFEQLRGGESALPADGKQVLENWSSRRFDELVEAAKQGDRRSIATMESDEPRYVSHRFLSLHRRDPSLVGSLEEHSDAGLPLVDRRTLAVRGELLALGAVSFESPNGDVVPMLGVEAIDAAGDIAGIESFDPEDIAAAVDRLDDLFVEGEGAPFAAVLGPLRDLAKAAGARSVEAWDAVISHDFVYVDHRQALALEANRATALEHVALQYELAGEGVAFPTVYHALSEHGAVDSSVIRSGHEDAEVSWGVTTLALVSDGPVDRLEVFEAEDVDAALARFDELTAGEPAHGSESGRPSNHATRLIAQAHAFQSAGDFDGFVDLSVESVERYDRRQLTGHPDVVGRDRLRKLQEAAGELGRNRVNSHVVATRGECLALHNVESEYESGLVPVLLVSETNGHLLTRYWLFDPDDYAGAIELLDELYLEQLDEDRKAAFKVLVRGTTAINRHDPELLDGMFADDLVAVDHELMGWPDLGVDGLIERVRSGIDAEMLFAIVEVHRISRVGGVVTSETWAPESGFGTVALGCFVLDQGRVAAWESFEPEELDAALARFDELTGVQEDAESKSAQPANHATRLIARAHAFQNAGDFESAVNLGVENLVRHDRRRVTGHPDVVGRDGLRLAEETAGELGRRRITSRVLATRGDHLALHQIESEYSSGVVPVLQVSETDGELMTRYWHFDPDGYGGAIELLDELYL